MMTEQEFLSRSKFGASRPTGPVNESLILPALAEFLARNGFHEVARVVYALTGKREDEKKPEEFI